MAFPLRLVTDNQLRARVFQHVTDALFGIGRVDRQVRAAGLEDAQQRRKPVQARLHDHGHGLFRLKAASQERVGKLIGAGVQLGVGEQTGVLLGGDDVGRGRELLGEKLGDGEVRDGGRRRIPGPGQTAGFVGREQGLDGQGAGGRSNDIRQQGAIGPHHVRDTGLIPKLCAVLQPSLQALSVLGEHQGEIVAGGAGIQGQGLEPQVRELQRLHGIFLQGKHDLEDGRAAEVAGGTDSLDNGFERGLLVGEGVEDRLAGAGQQVGEGGVQVGVQAQGQGVDEVADEGFQLGPGAVGCGRADDQVILSGIAGQERGKRSQKRHE